MTIQALSTIPLKRGDIFLTENPGLLGKAINLGQAITSKDGKATYSHAGIIVDSAGGSFEALWWVESRNLFKRYDGKRILVARHDYMRDATFDVALQHVLQSYGGDFYPVYRILFHLSPIFSKIATGKVVCSELVAAFLNRVELFPYVHGCTPDNLHDHICWAMNWKIIYRGLVD